MKILIADDDDRARLLLGSMLKRCGHDVHQAASGRGAWELWRDGAFQMIVLDGMMPDLDGREICRRIRAARYRADTYIILLTPPSGEETDLEAVSAGADAVIAKPFDQEVMAGCVRTAERMLGLRTILGETPVARPDRDRELRVETRVTVEYLSRASHDLSAPLRHILGLAQILARYPLEPDLKKYIGKIIDHGAHLRGLIDDIQRTTARA